MRKIIHDIGRGFYNLFIAIVIVAFLGSAIAVANYAVTQGSGTNFGSVVISSVHYAQQLICDLTTPSQCAAVNSSGQLAIQAPPTLPLPTGAATSANQSGTSATTAHGCSTAGYGELGCLGQIDDDVKGSIPAGTNVIGAIFGSPNVTRTDCSIALTAGGTAQNIITAGASLHGYHLMNIDTSAGSGEPVWTSETGTAAASTIGSYPLAAPTATTFAGAGSYSSEFGSGTNTNVSVVAATTGHKISCTKW